MKRASSILAVLCLVLPGAAVANDVIPVTADGCIRQSELTSLSDPSSLVRAGLAVSNSPDLAGYMDEAIAVRAGAWRCTDPSLIFRWASDRTGVHFATLQSIALNESSRNGVPWPWTINYAGRGFYFKDRMTAWQAANWLLANGIRLFDIGPMQVNWKYNGHRFRSTWEALQPSVNIDVAAQILKENYGRTGSWAKAVAWYHNPGNEARQKVYLARFLRHFQKVLVDRG